MKVFERIRDLQKQYPNLVDLYPKANNKSIKLRLDKHKVPLLDELSQILMFSNGFSVLDYCVLGIQNPKLRGLDLLPFSNELIFLATSGSEEYGIRISELGNPRVFVRIESIYGEIQTKYIAKSLEEFLELFVDKCELLLQNHQESDIVSYFDDDVMINIIPPWEEIEG